MSVITKAPIEVETEVGTEVGSSTEINALLPLLLISYMLQFLDKTTLGFAAIMGIRNDTHLVGQQYSWLSSSFYFGYLFACYPASYGFVKFPIGKYLSVTMLLWAIVLSLHAAARNFGSLLTLRILLGIFESVVSPGFSLLTVMYWKRSEHPFIHGVWYAGNGIASFFAGLIGYGINHIEGTIRPWQWLFIIFGITTFLWSLVLLILLPDSPATAKFITQHQREVLQARVQSQQHSKNSGQYESSQVKEALLDPKSWLMSIFIFSTAAPSGALSNFSSVIIQGFGFTTLQTLLVNMPAAVVVVFLGLGGSWLSGRIPRIRCILLAAYLLCALLGVLLIRQLPSSNRIGRLFGIYLFNSTGATFPIILSLVSSNISGYTKKTVVNAIFFIAYCVGSIVGPQTFISTEEPRGYPSAYAFMIFCLGLGVMMAIGLLVLMRRENNRRDREFGFIDPYEVTTREYLVNMYELDEDRTDKEEERTYRYMY
ncbi:MFS general substrate transporter [Coniochaeta ligniaria NRRL 30616]|uniref:MFS general substrate transporter n=1 Tax=Coniochaeta ligniaria NRRL 30616 TaxID=1408157 RepID=A0A1J7IAJ7_9PEZI|nr:MFS general substrate transporter [Coniochaeta ligniaria NRRL 30616]